MDRSEAATMLFRWEVEGERELVTAAEGAPADSLVDVVERLHRGRSRSPRPAPVPPPPLEWLQLREEREAAALMSRLRKMAPTLEPGSVTDLEERLTPTLQPRKRLAAIRSELNRLSIREQRESFHRELEAIFDVPRPAGLVALLLFSRDGRLLATEGDTSRLEAPAIAGLVRGAEIGSTWSLAHRGGHLFGHTGRRSALVAVFANRPRTELGATLRASVASLEQREQLLNAPDAPANHSRVSAYLRTVCLLLERERGVTPRLRG